MKLVIVDDEPRAARLLSSIIRSMPDAEKYDLHIFTNPKEACEWIISQPCEGIFLDVEMPELTGLQLAEKLKEQMREMPPITFVTAYPQFSLKAWDVDAVGYILKPYDDEQIAHAILKMERHSKQNSNMKRQDGTIQERPYVRCFPEFDVFVHGRPVHFSSKRSKELLALLVHHQGGWVPLDKITFLLLEEASEESAKSYVRMLLSRLRQSLKKHNIDDMIESGYGSIRINPERFDCDYYQYLNGKTELFKGEYMGTYAWAETERAYLIEREEKEPE